MLRVRSLARAAPLGARLASSCGAKESLIAANTRLLNAITAGDFATYRELCASDGTCIEPETSGQIVRGTKFHQHYFDLPSDGPSPPKTTTLTDMTVRVCGAGKMGFVTYNRLTQSGVDVAVAQVAPWPHGLMRLSLAIALERRSIHYLAQETRVWENADGGWRQVHFHKSS